MITSAEDWAIAQAGIPGDKASGLEAPNDGMKLANLKILHDDDERNCFLQIYTLLSKNIIKLSATSDEPIAFSKIAGAKSAS